MTSLWCGCAAVPDSFEIDRTVAARVRGVHKSATRFSGLSVAKLLTQRDAPTGAVQDAAKQRTDAFAAEEKPTYEKTSVRLDVLTRSLETMSHAYLRCNTDFGEIGRHRRDIPGIGDQRDVAVGADQL